MKSMKIGFTILERPFYFIHGRDQLLDCLKDGILIWVESKWNYNTRAIRGSISLLIRGPVLLLLCSGLRESTDLYDLRISSIYEI